MRLVDDQSGGLDDEPELVIVDPSAWPGANEWRERHEREKAVARTRYLALVTAEVELSVWVADHPGVEVSSHGGFAPQQWYGSVDGHRFYLHERHDEWRIELDLRPSGRFARVWVGGDLDDEDATEQRELENGDVIADGTTNAPDYGRTPTERAEFIVTMIRDHLRRTECQLHANGQLDLARQVGADPNFCPACGTKLP